MSTSSTAPTLSQSFIDWLIGDQREGILKALAGVTTPRANAVREALGGSNFNVCHPQSDSLTKDMVEKVKDVRSGACVRTFTIALDGTVTVVAFVSVQGPLLSLSAGNGLVVARLVGPNAILYARSCVGMIDRFVTGLSTSIEGKTVRADITHQDEHGLCPETFTYVLNC